MLQIRVGKISTFQASLGYIACPMSIRKMSNPTPLAVLRPGAVGRNAVTGKTYLRCLIGGAQERAAWCAVLEGEPWATRVPGECGSSSK